MNTIERNTKKKEKVAFKKNDSMKNDEKSNYGKLEKNEY